MEGTVEGTKWLAVKKIRAMCFHEASKTELNIPNLRNHTCLSHFSISTEWFLPHSSQTLNVETFNMYPSPIDPQSLSTM